MGPASIFDVARPDTSQVRVRAHVTTDALDLGDNLAFVRSPSCGGLGVFVGTVRITSSTEAVDGLSPNDVVGLRYDAYPAGAIAEFERIAQLAARRFDAIDAISISHRYGYVELGQDAVVVAVSAPHRHEALEATTFVIDAVKFRAPIWKQEVFRDGHASAWAGCEHVHVAAS
jgi:molybdopterin synthase catalytic subunit